MIAEHQPRSLPTVIVLAAGSGSRFRASGGQTHKLAAQLGERNVLEHVLAAVRASGLPWHLVAQGEGGPGMGDSIAAGVRNTANAQGWLMLPGDLALVQSASILAVAHALADADTTRVVLPFFDGKQGHPVGFARSCGDALQALGGDKGASPIVREARSQNQVLELVLDDVGIVTDIDTLDDLQHAQALLQSRNSPPD